MLTKEDILTGLAYLIFTLLTAGTGLTAYIVVTPAPDADLEFQRWIAAGTSVVAALHYSMICRKLPNIAGRRKLEYSLLALLGVNVCCILLTVPSLYAQAETRIWAAAMGVVALAVAYAIYHWRRAVDEDREQLALRRQCGGEQGVMALSRQYAADKERVRLERQYRRDLRRTRNDAERAQVQEQYEADLARNTEAKNEAEQEQFRRSNDQQLK